MPASSAKVFRDHGCAGGRLLCAWRLADAGRVVVADRMSKKWMFLSNLVVPFGEEFDESFSVGSIGVGLPLCLVVVSFAWASIRW